MKEITHTPASAQEWFDAGVFYRQQGRFGEAINAFQRAISEAHSSASSSAASLIAKAQASIDLIKEITGFVNKDLMNP